jgi:S1-C subfamily serine protease
MLVLPLLLLLPGQIETVRSDDFTKEQQVAAVTATVRLLNLSQGTTGSGAIIGKSGPFLYILTANHVVAKADRLEVHVFTAESYPKPAEVYRGAEVLAGAAGPDVALVRLPTRDTSPGTIKICPPRLLPKTAEIPALTVGCDLGDPPACRVVKVLGKKRVRKKGEEGITVYWEVDQPSPRGRSGGPLIDKRGYLLGVGSISGDGKGYFTYATEIYALLTRHGLKSLYQGEE